MAIRRRKRQAWSYFERVLATGEVAEKGNVACIDTAANGQIVAAKVDTGLLPIGYFEESLTGDGTKTVRIQLFREIWVDTLVNAAGGDAVTDAMVGQACYLDAGGATVQSVATGASIAGRVWGVTTEGVLVEMALSIGMQGPEGP